MRIPQPIGLIWFPTWSCQFYSRGQSHGALCPYCPLGLTADGVESRVLVDNVPRGLNLPQTEYTAQHIAEFLIANASILDRYVALSGGEPLVSPNLPKVLSMTGFRWSITSNTQNGLAIERLVDAHLMTNCVAWTCSYHPLANRDATYAANLYRLADLLPGVPIRATLVISKHTLPVLRRSVEFLKSLPLTGFQFHLDSHPTDGRSADEILVDAMNSLAEFWEGDNLPVPYAGNVPQGVNCDRFGASMALSPDGRLFECVTKMHLDQDPVCEVDGKTDLAKMQQRPDRVAFCDVACFACCDHVKHQG